MLRILVDERHLTDAPPASEAPFALLKDSPLVTACAGFISGLLQLGNEHVAAQDEPAVGQSLVALYASLLDEALHRTAASTSSGRIDRRLQIEQHIGQHLADPELSPRGIAESLGVSVRTVHAAFADGPDGVAAHIRARRVEMAKALLVQRVEPPHVPSLARSVGLTPAVLSRAFAAGTGLTVREWWRRAAEPERPSGS